MLPSRGFFKKNDCPLFERRLCERPHCHFRHRRRTSVSATASNQYGQDIVAAAQDVDDSVDNGGCGAASADEATAAGGQTTVTTTTTLTTTVAATATTTTTTTTTTASTNSVSGGGGGDDGQSLSTKKEVQQGSDSLFAKLVNQSNPYERISRHIPCAYTPTPQITSAQPKNRLVSAKARVNSSMAIDVLAKTQSYSTEYSSSVHNSKQNSSSSYVPSQKQEVNSLKDISNSLQNESSNKYTVNSVENSVLSKSSYFDSKSSNSLTYEPQTTSKPINCDFGKTASSRSTASYVPSKVTTASETKYTPNSNDSSSLSSSSDYVPSRERSEGVQYVPEGGRTASSEVAYKPSDKSSGKETQYQPDAGPLLADYVPTEKTATQANGDKAKEKYPNFEFRQSEIEMMKMLLSETEKKGNEEESTKKTDESEKVEENCKKDGEKERSSSKSHHSSSSRHRSKSSSSHSHSSSKSKHSSSKHSSRSSSSSSSRHHSSSSSSRHRSSSRKRSSDRERSSSDAKKSGSGSSSSSSRHKSHKSSKWEKDKGEKESHKRDEGEKDRRDTVVDLASDDDGDDNVTDALSGDRENDSGENSGSEADGDRGSKRKNTWLDEERNSKLFKKSAEELFDELEEDPETVEEQCREIFNSYSNSLESQGQNKPKVELTAAAATTIEDGDTSLPGKKRTAHSTNVFNDHSVLRQKTMRKLNNIKSAQEVMMERYKTLEKAKEVPAAASAPKAAPISGLSRPSIRIAAVSNTQQLLQAKKAIQEKFSQGQKVNERTTIAQTVARGGSRVAHTLSSKNTTERPNVTAGSKSVPRGKRQIYLDKLLLETNQIYPTKSESAEEAMRLEEEVFKAHSGSFPAYHAAFVSLLMKTRRRIAAVKGEPSSSTSSKPKMSHYDVLSGGKKNFSIIRTKKVDISMLSERHIYEELLRCKLTPEELKINSFPIEGAKSGYATCLLNFELKYNAHYLHIKKMTGNRRYCIRCSKQYEVDPVTFRQYKEGPETCSYHPGRKKFGGRNSERIYNCCNSSSTEGCATHVRHVTDCNNYDNLPNCVKTLSKDDDVNPGVFALDCEMVYTRLGYELARVTVVNLKKEVVYDTLVKPKYPVDCYNTVYSGIEEKMLEGVETTLKDVQAVLLSMFSNKTILIGHSLDSDLRALHLIHDTVVDTAVVYKNEKYHPYKYSLKDLCAKKISKIIQDNVGGHDSAEDATAALEIMLNHVKEEVSKYDSLESYEADRFG